MICQKYSPIIIFIVGVFLFTFGLGSQEIVGFESRFYVFALEMWRHGVTWFPTTYQQPYPDYPVTSTVLIYVVSLLFGSVNKLTAVLPSALAAAGTLSVTYLIAAKYSRTWAWCSVFFLIFTLGFIAEARTISLDQMVTFVTVLCFYFGMIRSSHGFLIALLLICGFAVRGPIGIVVPAGVMCVSFLLDKQIKRFFVIGVMAACLLVMCSAALLAMAYHVGGVSFLQDVLRMEVTGRLHDVKTLPYTFYLKESIGAYAIAYPLALASILGLITSVFKPGASPDIKLVRKCIGWAAVILLGLSIPVDKKIRYILPMVPALALICGYLFIAYRQNRYLSVLYKMVYGLCSVFPLIALVALSILFKKNVEMGFNFLMLSIVFALLQLVIIVLHKRHVIVLGVAAVAFFIANVFIVEVINLYINRTRDFVLDVEALRQHHHSPLVFFQEGSDGLVIKYWVNMPKEALPIYLYQENALLTLKVNTLVIVGQENMSHISADVTRHFYVVKQGNVGHDAVVVMKRIN